ncbi:pleiotropic regulatory protein RsmS [Marinomonas sp. THO17]
MSLDKAPDHVKLAVDLIELLETNEIAPDVAVEALRLVLKDFENKLSTKE